MPTQLQGFILDMDGTVYLSDRALPGAVETIAALHQRGFKVAFISNRPLEPGSAYAAKLTRLGIPTPPEDVITSGYVLSHHLARVAPGAHVFVIGEPPLLEEIRQAGLQLKDPAQIEYVIAALEATTGKKVELIAGKLSPMMIQAGAECIGVPADQCLVVGDRLEADRVMGSQAGARTALELSGVTRREHLSKTPVQPDHVLENIGGILDLPSD